jgi:UDP:flavonoid glycosyltransferase YjiC (YdhE family)
MNILYGVQTTGNGHISRSREVIRQLKRSGHQVQVILSGNDPHRLAGVDVFKPAHI